mgnify:CR=1 FL=1
MAKEFQGALYNQSNLFSERSKKLVPIVEVIILTIEPEYFINKKTIDKKLKADQFRFTVNEESITKFILELTELKENIIQNKKACDNTVIITNQK